MSSRTSCAKAGALAAAACLALLYATSSNSLQPGSAAEDNPGPQFPQFEPLIPATGVFADVEVAWMIPTPPKGSFGKVRRLMTTVLLLFHGCTHEGKDWFNYPEERVLVQAALQQSMVVIAFTSQDRWTGCWVSSFPPTVNEEAMDIKAAYTEVIQHIEKQVRALHWLAFLIRCVSCAAVLALCGSLCDAKAGVDAVCVRMRMRVCV